MSNHLQISRSDDADPVGSAQERGKEGSRLEKDQIIPAFTLPGGDGMPHSPWDYKQRENLIVLFTPDIKTDEGRALLTTYAQYYKDFREEACSILAIRLILSFLACRLRKNCICHSRSSLIQKGR